MADDVKDLRAEIVKLSASIKKTQSPDFRIVYANSSRMGISPWDVRMTVGTVVEVDDGQVNEDQITLIMSPAHAKVFLKNLVITIDKFEATFGPINDPMQKLQPSAASEKPRKAKKD